MKLLKAELIADRSSASASKRKPKRSPRSAPERRALPRSRGRRSDVPGHGVRRRADAAPDDREEKRLATNARSRSPRGCAGGSTLRTAGSCTATSSPRTSSSRPTPRIGEQPKIIDFGLAKLASSDREARAHAHRPDGRHARVHGARADRGQDGRRARRRLLARLRALRDAHRPHRRSAGEDDVQVAVPATARAAATADHIMVPAFRRRSTK